MSDLRPADPPAGLTHGTILRWRRVPGLVLAETRYAPHQRIAAHEHANDRFVLVLRGAVTETTAAGSVVHTANTLLFRPAHERHAWRVSGQGATCLVVDADARWLERAARQAPVLTASTVIRGGLAVHLAQRLHGEFGLRDEVSRLAIESLALGILAELSRRAAQEERPAAPAWLRQARAFIDAHFAERLALATLAALVGVHPVHLARTFRRVYDTTVAEYVRTARVEFAKRELSGGAPLSDIAAAAGFCDQSHFTRVFKRHTGLSPHEYRLATAG